MCLLHNKHTLQLFKLLLVRSVGLLWWIFFPFSCFYADYSASWSRWIKWTNNGEIIHTHVLPAKVLDRLWLRYVLGTPHQQFIGRTQFDLFFFCRNTFLTWSRKRLVPSDQSMLQYRRMLDIIYKIHQEIQLFLLHLSVWRVFKQIQKKSLTIFTVCVIYVAWLALYWY